jgi:hypothetical protein
MNLIQALLCESLWLIYTDTTLLIFYTIYTTFILYAFEVIRQFNNASNTVFIC